MLIKKTKKSIIIRKSSKDTSRKKIDRKGAIKKSKTKNVKKLKSRPAKKIARKSQKYSIEFCNKCGSIMIPEKGKKSMKMKCRSCNYVSKNPVKKVKLKKSKKNSSRIHVLESDYNYLPQTKKLCEKCENTNAYFWLQQTKSDDEPPTQFFRCTKCKHTWREYK